MKKLFLSSYFAKVADMLPVFLQDDVRGTKAADAILERIAAGKPYVGSSAGSIVPAPDIRYIEAMDSPM